MDYRILGPLEIRAADRVPVTGARAERVLAALLLHANRVVPVASLVEAVWNDNPPDTAERQARNCVSALRRALLAHGAAGLIETDGTAGYLARVAPGELDSERFDAMVSGARRLGGTGDRERAAEALRAALALWRGPALAGIDSPAVQAWAAGWNEWRMAAWAECIDHELALGYHHAVLAELIPLVRRQPLRERLVAQSMLALYRAGRASEALDLYRHTRTRLADELGMDPDPQLDRLHTLMLRRDPGLDLDAAVAPPCGTKPVGARIAAIS